MRVGAGASAAIVPSEPISASPRAGALRVAPARGGDRLRLGAAFVLSALLHGLVLAVAPAGLPPIETPSDEIAIEAEIVATAPEIVAEVEDRSAVTTEQSAAADRPSDPVLSEAVVAVRDGQEAGPAETAASDPPPPEPDRPPVEVVPPATQPPPVEASAPERSETGDADRPPVSDQTVPEVRPVADSEPEPPSPAAIDAAPVRLAEADPMPPVVPPPAVPPPIGPLPAVPQPEIVEAAAPVAAPPILEAQPSAVAVGLAVRFEPAAPARAKPRPVPARPTPQAVRRPPVTSPPPPARRPVATRPASESRPASGAGSRTAVGEAVGFRARPAAEQAADYRAIVAAEINRRKAYPPAARQAGLSGRVVLRFTVGPGGRVGGAAVVQSSGHASLDDAARSLVGSLSLPPPPGGQFSVTTAVNYRAE
ncbi:hypothetical protein C2U72_03760 [Prosthecomicrobium hirschii]|nr:hypothetical protein C2U72_03760 [Prosthecomicrobium hirschii]